jgi:hypothetical protein
MTGRGRRVGVCLALAALALAACGKKSPPVAPELRAPQAIGDLSGVVEESAITLSWTPPNRRADNTRLRDFTLMRIFRAEDSGTGEPRAAMSVDGRIAGYDEIAAIRGAEPEPAVRRGPHLVLSDRQGLTHGRRYTYVILAGDPQGRIGSPSPRVSVTYAVAPGEPESVVAEPRDGAVRVTWNAPTRMLDGSAATEPVTYQVLRGTSEDGELSPITPARTSERTLTDTGLQNDRAYVYAVRAAREVAGTTVYGRPSARVSATPRDTTPPSPPTNLVAIPSEGVVRLSWNPSPESKVTGYIVYRATESGAFERIGSTSAPSTTFVDRAATRGVNRYVVTSQDSAARPNESRRSNEVRVTLP